MCAGFGFACGLGRCPRVFADPRREAPPLPENLHRGSAEVAATDALADFAKMVEIFDAHNVSFEAVTQQFNTTTSTSMGRLILNALVSFAQFEREVTGERIRDKIAASKRKGMWMEGVPPLGYDVRTGGWSSIPPKPIQSEPYMSAT
jgi:DNA invertase Pin-like site-specific DNA recombinase